jgi:hypothetical protein
MGLRLSYRTHSRSQTVLSILQSPSHASLIPSLGLKAFEFQIQRTSVLQAIKLHRVFTRYSKLLTETRWFDLLTNLRS